MTDFPDDSFNPASIASALPIPVLAVGAGLDVLYVNPAAEQFFALPESALRRQTLDCHLPDSSPVLPLLRQVIAEGGSVAEYGLAFQTVRTEAVEIEVQICSLSGSPGTALLLFHPRAIPQRIDRQLMHRGAARSLAGMAAVLAHEIKNPLSGIRGAAQLLEMPASPGDRELTALIRDEADRICALVNEMESFADPRPLSRKAENIHEILAHVVRLARAGFAQGLKLEEHYDPSLPDVYGNRDKLIQVFINIIKNASEAVEGKYGNISITTAYRHGVRVQFPGMSGRIHLPIEICVTDNGSGVPDEIADHIFDPFVSGKRGGTGLGLALAAKYVNDHSGTIECERLERGTRFRVLLPASIGDTHAMADGGQP